MGVCVFVCVCALSLLVLIQGKFTIGKEWRVLPENPAPPEKLNPGSSRDPQWVTELRDSLGSVRAVDNFSAPASRSPSSPSGRRKAEIRNIEGILLSIVRGLEGRRHHISIVSVAKPTPCPRRNLLLYLRRNLPMQLHHQNYVIFNELEGWL